MSNRSDTKNQNLKRKWTQWSVLLVQLLRLLVYVMICCLSLNLCHHWLSLIRQFHAYGNARATLDKQSCVITSTLFEMNSTSMCLCDLNFSCLITSITSPEVSSCQNKNVSKSNMADRVYISWLQTLIL